MRVWLHEHMGDESGWSIWSFDYLGFSTWASTRDEVISKAPEKLTDHLGWLKRHRSDIESGSLERMEIVEEVAGDEPLFSEDLAPATHEEISSCIEFLGFSRSDLFHTVEDLSDSVLNWELPGRDLPEWAWWRTIRLILKHIAFVELGYYLPVITQPMITPEYLSDAGWCRQLSLSRRETIRCLENLKSAEDLVRLSRAEEEWTLRKVLRRLVWHEIVHWKSIKRIIREYHQSFSSDRQSDKQ